jgi:cupin fold WbuC family metalloprotein
MDKPTISQADLVGADRLDALCHAARSSSRKRAHLLLHGGHDDQVQRLLIAVEPGTYVRAHKHSEQWEMLIVLRGRVDILMLSDDAALRQRAALSPASAVIQIPMGHCHCALALEAGSVVMEIKPGPYRPNEFMAWAPEENSSTAGEFLSWAGDADIGQSWAGSAGAR